MSATRPSAPSRFELRQRVPVGALDAELTQYVHRPTGARHIHVDAPLEDSAFLMAFLTPAPDSSAASRMSSNIW